MSDLIARSVGADIAMEMETSKEVPLVEIDPNQLELALLNLSVNARDAMPEGGTLRIGVNRVSWEDGFSRHGLAPANYVVISVEDTGTGMDERSEEHTSELQSLMRISYAVFCLKKKTQITHYQ